VKHLARIYNLTEGSIIKKLFYVALPVLLLSLSQMAYNLTDIFWVGHVELIGIVESQAISAVGTAAYITWFAFGIIMIGRIGTSVKVAHSVGENKTDRLAGYAENGLILQAILGLFFSVVVVVFRRQIISIFNIGNENVVEYTVNYLAIVGSFLFVQFLTYGFVAINDGVGKTMTNFLIMLIGIVVNMILDPLFILVLRMGVSGAALATVIGQIITLVAFVFLYAKKNKMFRFRLSAFRKKYLLEIVKIGLPTGLQSMLFTSISIFIARMVYEYGEYVVAAQRVGVQIEQLTWMIAGGFQTALTVFVAQNFGARLHGRIRKGFGIMSGLLLPYAAAVALCLYFFSDFLLGIFISDPVSLSYGVAYLKIISLAQIFMMMEAIGTGLYNGVGKTYIPSIIGIVGNVLRIPLAIELVKVIDENGIWWSLNISDMFKGAILYAGSLILLAFLERIKLNKKQNRQLVEET